jgi:TetR/AcrR family transcriptional regulator
VTRRSPSAARRQRDPERTKARILEAATAEFSTHGYAGARVGRIAERAGVNKQLISYYFGGKEGLYRTIAGGWLRGEQEAAGTRNAMSLPDLVTSYIRDVSPELGRLLVWEGLATGAGAEDPGEDVRNARMSSAVEDLRARQRAGELAEDIDPRAFLLAFMCANAAAYAMPHLVRSIYGKDIDPTSPEFVEEYAAQIARMVTHLTSDSTAR